MRKRGQKGLKVSNFALYWSFLSDIMAVKGLKRQSKVKGLKRQSEVKGLKRQSELHPMSDTVLRREE